jgi:uncharacterized protein (TIGR02217 family)
MNNDNFINIRFPTRITYGTEYVIETKTTIITSKDGSEKRISNISQPRKKYNILLAKSTDEDVKVLNDFFKLVKGSYQSFRFADKTNSKALNQSMIKIDQAGCEFQLANSSLFVTEDNTKISETCRITKPIKDTVIITDQNNTRIWPKNIDYNAGIVNFWTPQEQSNIKASFEFDIHVRFDCDVLSFVSSRHGFEQERSSKITLIEVI